MNYSDLVVKQEQRNARSTEFGDYLSTFGILVSSWMPEFSRRRRDFKYNVPALDTDALLYNPVTSELLALFETKRGTEPLSRAEREVVVDLANKCRKPAFVLRYRTSGDSWRIQPVPLNDYASDFRVGDYVLFEDEFEGFLRSLGWRGYSSESAEDTLYFPMIEFNKFRVKSLNAYRPVDTKLTQDYAEAPEFKLWTNMANDCGVPALSVMSEPSLGWFMTYPLNDAAREYCREGQYFSETEFVQDVLYRMHGQQTIQIDGLRMYRPKSNQQRIPPTPPRTRQQVSDEAIENNRLKYLDIKYMTNRSKYQKDK